MVIHSAQEKAVQSFFYLSSKVTIEAFSQQDLPSAQGKTHQRF